MSAVAESWAPAGVRLLDPAGNRPVPLPPRTAAGPDHALIALVERAGLVGRGGGGFPTARKLAAVASAGGRRRPVVVANGAEGEPLSRKDEELLATVPHLVLDGIVLAARAVGAVTADLCVHRGSRALPVLAGAVRRRAPGDVTVHVRQTPRRYVGSEESALVHWLSGGEAKPTTRPPALFRKGVRGAPTLISNVETLAGVALAVRHGPAARRVVGDPAEPGTLLVTVAGGVAVPGVVEVPTGEALGRALGRVGVGRGDVLAVLAGGFGGGWLAADTAWWAPLTGAGMRAAGAALGPGLMIVLPPGACGVAETARVARYLAGESAGQCGPCLFGLPSIASALEAVARGDRDARAAVAAAHRWAATIPGRGACRHPDGAARMVSTALRVFADDVARHAHGTPCAGARSAALGVPAPSTEDWR
jgi:NADH:ubiquinone oxidoreductase subunit F (NADH-binding)